MEISVRQLRDIFSDAINSIKSDRDLWTADKKERALHKLKSHDLMKSNRPEFYRLNEIAAQEQDGLIIWYPRYLNECLNDVYIKLICGTLVRELDWFMESLFDPIMNQELPHVLNEIQKKERAVLKIKSQHRVNGTAINSYINNTDEGFNGLLYGRFEIIKELNTEFGNNNYNTHTADYPFFKVNGSQFYEFEYVYRFLKIFEKIKGLTDDNHPVFRSSLIETVIDDYLEYYGILDKNHKVIDHTRLGPYCHAFYVLTRENTKTVFKKQSPLTEFQEWVKEYYSTQSKDGRLSDGKSHQEEAEYFINTFYPNLNR
ncbi:hypothetical protein [Flagellimonas sp.]|uniref:hypothetical protein n=1 Tax=Flagellimonas sp. TaxID=2058762 RepID=UPI003BA8E6AC